MARRNLSLRLAALVALTTTAPLASAANEVEISSPDETIRVTGKLVGFDGTSYTIQTSLGNLSFGVGDVVCTGEACPYIKPPTSEFAVAGAGPMAVGLAPRIIGAYANHLTARLGLSDGSEGRLYQITDAEDDDLARIELVASSSSSGLAALLQGDSSLALSSRPARPAEVRAFEASGLGDIRGSSQEHVLALDGLVIITAPGNPLRAITQENIARVFAGEITNWADLGGTDAPIRVYARAPNSGSGEEFAQSLLAPRGLELQRNAIIVGSDAEIASIVAKDPFGIGFTRFAHQSTAKPLAIEGVCGLQTAPSKFTILTEEYPLTQRLYLYNTAREEPLHVEGLVKFALSEPGQKAVQDAGFINQNIAKATVDTQGLRFASAIVANRSAAELPELKRMVAEMISAERLSTTFRFLAGSSQLDTRAQSDLGRLTSALNKAENAGKVVMLMGFSDSIGDPFLNKQLSERRAVQIRDALLEADPGLADKVRFEVSGYGEVSPLGCNETEEGRLINRRVEVWLKDETAGVSN